MLCFNSTGLSCGPGSLTQRSSQKKLTAMGVCWKVDDFENYPCERLGKFINNVPDAKATLEEIRESL
jgi:hypothetical protein